MNRLRFPILAFVAALCAPSLLAQSVTVTYSYGGAPLPIFVNSADIATFLNVFVPRSLTVQSVRVTVDIDYPRPTDLNVFFYSPQATRTKLLERNCGSSGTLSNITFDDTAGFYYRDYCATTSGGSYKGNEPLANSQGQNSFGIWSLGVENNGSDDFIGFVRGVRVSITGTQASANPVSGPDAVFSGSSFVGDRTVAPGEFITIIGANLGPIGGVQAPAGNLPFSLGGTSVTFGGMSAALKYSSSLALRAQVPYSVVPGNTDMVITYNGVSGSVVPLTVVDTKPGIFTTSPSGKGAANAFNPDGSVNSATSAAPKGGDVAVFATGLGTVSPALATGQSPPSDPLSATTAPVTAFIDGVSVPVQFAGAAPGTPGSYQVNIQVPRSASSGARSLVIFANGVPSQSAVTLWVQ